MGRNLIGYRMPRRLLRQEDWLHGWKDVTYYKATAFKILWNTEIWVSKENIRLERLNNVCEDEKASCIVCEDSKTLASRQNRLESPIFTFTYVKSPPCLKIAIYATGVARMGGNIGRTIWHDWRLTMHGTGTSGFYARLLLYSLELLYNTTGNV